MKERNKAIALRVFRGETYVSGAKDYGISNTRVRQIAIGVRRRLIVEWPPELQYRIALGRAGNQRAVCGGRDPLDWKSINLEMVRLLRKEN